QFGGATLIFLVAQPGRGILAGQQVQAQCNGVSFRNFMLVTHRGVSGPAILQISSYWQPGDDLRLDR
ncbi:hypothetical protein XarbCFBP8150_21320, partial [Xanthomonas arboricola]